MKRVYVLIPKNGAGKNEFERIAYLEAEEVKYISSTQLEELSKHLDTKEFIEAVKQEKVKEDRAYRKYEELRIKILKEVEKSELEKIQSFEETIDLYFEIFRKHFEKYPFRCDWAAFLTMEVFFTQLGYEVKVMESRTRELQHWFTEITDKNTNRIWIFDPVAEQFKYIEQFRDDYNASRYEKN